MIKLGESDIVAGPVERTPSVHDASRMEMQLPLRLDDDDDDDVLLLLKLNERFDETNPLYELLL